MDRPRYDDAQRFDAIRPKSKSKSGGGFLGAGNGGEEKAGCEEREGSGAVAWRESFRSGWRVEGGG